MPGVCPSKLEYSNHLRFAVFVAKSELEVVNIWPIGHHREAKRSLGAEAAKFSEANPVGRR
jgi:hypothetical protein